MALPLFVTGNKNKLREAQEILGSDLENIDIDLPEIQEIDSNLIVKDKARRAYDEIGKPVIIEDTGLYFDAMNGFPGALIKWVMKTVGVDGVCKMLEGYFNRSGYAKTVLCYYDGEEYHLFKGVIGGRIPLSPVGENSFGWDPCFIPKGHNKTFAQMSAEEKNEISMRKIAFEKLREFFEK